jgi:hypothetical protein
MEIKLAILALGLAGGIPLIVGGIQVAGWRHSGLIATLIIAGALFIVATVWAALLPDTAPPLYSFMSRAAASPSSWIVLALFIAGLIIFPRARGPSEQVNSETSDGQDEQLKYFHTRFEQLDKVVLTSIWQRINEISQSVQAIQKKTAVPPNLGEDLVEALRSIEEALQSQLARMRDEIKKFPERANWLDRDVHSIFFFATDIATLAVLEGLIEENKFLDIPLGPDVDQKQRSKCLADLEAYFRRVSNAFANTHRGLSVASVLENAGIEAEHDLRATPTNERPDWIDVLDYRPLKIAQMRQSRLLAFLLHERDQKKEEIRQQRPHLLERLSARDTP